MSDQEGGSAWNGWATFWTVVVIFVVIWAASHGPSDDVGGCEDWIQDERGGYCGP